jgi:hypothetical protein
MRHLLRWAYFSLEQLFGVFGGGMFGGSSGYIGFMR